MLFVSGPAASDAVTGVNKYTFRSGRQSYQDVLAAKSYRPSPTGKKVLVFAQEGTFGKSNADAVKAVIGGAGATVDNLFVPASATEFTGFAAQAKNAKADMIFVAWAGTTAPAMWPRWTSRACSARPWSSPASTSARRGRRSARPAQAVAARALLRRRQRQRGHRGAAQGPGARAARSTCSTRTASPPRR